MAIKKQNNQGFALFIAVIFMSVMLTLGLALSSLGYKQQIISSDAIRSQTAFYVASSAIECALYTDQQPQGGVYLFEYPAADPSPALAPVMPCGTMYWKDQVWSSEKWIVTERLDFSGGCADVTISKPADVSLGITYVFSQGYDVSCATLVAAETDPNIRFASRGLSFSYGGP